MFFIKHGPQAWRDRYGLLGILLLIGITVVYIVITLALGILYPLGVVVLVSSGLFLHWSLVGYYGLQKYSSVLERPGLVANAPRFLPMCAVLAILSSAIAIVVHVRWYFLPVLIVVWVCYGFSCAERAIRRYMRSQKCDRKLAIFAINDAQGRTDVSHLFSMHKYPFP